MKNLHIQVWIGSQSARITEMKNAGMRGKTCRVLRIQGDPARWATTQSDKFREAAFVSTQIFSYIDKLTGDERFDGVVLDIEALDTCKQKDCVSVAIETVKGIDAAKEPLTAGVDGKWSASADADGVSLCQIDDVNQWAEITSSRQTCHQAYTCAAKVWDAVKTAKTLSEASGILRAAGCKLHGYCGMD